MGVVYLATDTRLEKALQQHSGSLLKVTWRFGFEALRSDPPYSQLCAAWVLSPE